MRVAINLYDTKIVHEKSMYGVFDLLADVGGLGDIFFVAFAFILSRYNNSLFLFNSINKLYQIKNPVTSFAKFICFHNFGCFRTNDKA